MQDRLRLSAPAPRAKGAHALPRQPAADRVDLIMGLQRAGGNQAVQHLLRGQHTRPSRASVVGSSTRQCLARTIVLRPPNADSDNRQTYAAWHTQTVEALAALVQSVATVAVDKDTGVLTLSATGDAPTLAAHKGYQLLSRMIASGHTVRIVPEGSEPMARVAEKDVPSAAKSGVGAGSTIEFPPNIIEVCKKLGGLYAISGEDGKPVPETAPSPAVMLGHELIHADHAQRGTYVPALDESKRAHAYAGFEEQVLEEELRTVGLGGTDLGADEITENQLRRELGLPSRVSYRPHHMNVDAKAVKERTEREAKAVKALMNAIAAYNTFAKPSSLPGIGYNSSDDVRALRGKLDQPLSLAQEYGGDPAADAAVGAINQALESSLEFA